MSAIATASGRPRSHLVSLATNKALIGALTILFTAPSVIFAGWLQPIPAAIVVIGCLIGLGLALNARSEGDQGWIKQPIEFGRLGALIGLSAVIFILGGQCHVFYPNPDWLTRDAVLADLVRSSDAPVYLLSDGAYVLRAPLGMYMVPGLIGRGVGSLAVAHAALLTQNTLLLGAILYLLTEGGRTWIRIGILILFGGLCLLPRLSAVLIQGANPSLLVSDARPFDEWNLYFQYSSSIVQFFWVPNHALPGWWIAAVAILCLRRQLEISFLLFAIASSLLWSPLAILPGVPFAAVIVARRGWHGLARARLWVGIVAGLCFLPIALYLVLGSGEIAHGLGNERPAFWTYYSMFILVQLPAGMYVVARWERLSPDLKLLCAISLTILVILPFVSFGPSNDLVMRGSIPALVVVSFCFAEIVLRDSPDRPDWRRIAIVLIALGSLSAVVEVSRAIRVPSFSISDCTLIEASSDLNGGDLIVPTNYVVPARGVPPWLMTVPDARLIAAQNRKCWPLLRRPDMP